MGLWNKASEAFGKWANKPVEYNIGAKDKGTEANAAEGGGFNSANAEQIEMFDRPQESLAEIGSKNIDKGVEKAKNLVSSVGNKMKSWASPMFAAGEAAKRAKEAVSSRASAMSEAFGRATESVVAGAKGMAEKVGKKIDSGTDFLESLPDKSLKVIAEQVGLKPGLSGKIELPKLDSPSVQKSILGLSPEDRSMGGELVVREGVFQAIKKFVERVNQIIATVEIQRQSTLARQQEGARMMEEKIQNSVTGKNVAKSYNRMRDDRRAQAREKVRPMDEAKREELREQEMANAAISAKEGVHEPNVLKGQERAAAEKAYEGLFDQAIAAEDAKRRQSEYRAAAEEQVRPWVQEVTGKVEAGRRGTLVVESFSQIEKLVKDAARVGITIENRPVQLKDLRFSVDPGMNKESQQAYAAAA